LTVKEIPKVSQIRAAIFCRRKEETWAKEELIQAVQIYVKHKKYFEAGVTSMQARICNIALWKRIPDFSHIDNA
jgi:hypothetical protein